MKNHLSILVVFTIILTSLFSIQIQAINLEISKKPIQNSVILDLNEPAIYELTITNLETTDNFEIYSLVGIDILPSTPFEIKGGETKSIIIKIMPQESLRIKRELPLNFIYKIKNSKNEIQTDSLLINIIALESAFFIDPQEINPKSDIITISVKNNINFDFENINLKITSAFFDHEQKLNLLSKESKDVIINIDKEKANVLGAGKYLMNTQIKVRDNTFQIESEINFLEQEDIYIVENEEGIFIQRKEIIKKNLGNVKKTVDIRIENGLIANLFTSFNINPTRVESFGSKRILIWEKELIPNEEFKITVKTNWFYPVIIIVLILFGIVLIRRSIYTDLELRKKVTFVKTKGGQFALKISLIVKSKNFIERIKITDKLPNLVKLYDKFGLIPPDNIDMKNRRLEWNLISLNEGESRIFTYIIYSKIGVVGRFELPNAIAVYEKEGKVKEVTSNRSFYINEPREQN